MNSMWKSVGYWSSTPFSMKLRSRLTYRCRITTLSYYFYSCFLSLFIDFENGSLSLMSTGELSIVTFTKSEWSSFAYSYYYEESSS